MTARRLLRGGEPLPITARVFDILAVLVRHQGQALDKEHLIAQVWGDVAIEEGNLARNVSTLRKLLGEAPDDHRFIVTLPGRGYQFVGEVQAIADEPPAAPETAAPASVPAPARRTPRLMLVTAMIALVALLCAAFWLPRGTPAAPPSPRIVVMPFKNLGPAEEEYVAAGLTEEITSRLAALDSLRVVSRTSATRYDRSGRTVRQIGEDLGADYLLEGAVLWNRGTGEAARVRITAQLIRVSHDTHVWAETFDREIPDLLRMESEIATRVVRALRGRVLAHERAALEKPPTTNVEAYTAFLQAILYASRPDVSEENVAEVIRHLQHAVDLDPDFALAHARLASAHLLYHQFGYDTSRERLAVAKQALDRAGRLAPDLPERAFASSNYWMTMGDARKALAESEAGERERPNDPRLISSTGLVLWRMGRWAEAAPKVALARALEPRDAMMASRDALLQLGLRRYPEAQHAIERSLMLEPDQVIAYALSVWHTWLSKGDLVAARAILDRLPATDDWRFMELRFLQALFERRYDDARRVQAPWSGQWMRHWVLVRPVVLFEAQACRLQGDRACAAAAFEKARALLDLEAQTTPNDGRVRGSLAVALAGLGRRDEAIREAHRALALMPHPYAFDTAVVREDAALALTMADEHGEALDLIETLLTTPAHFSVHSLRLDPRWDPLRGEPRFRALTASAPLPTQ